MTRRVVWTGLAALALLSCGGEQGQTVLLRSDAGPARVVLGVGVGYAHNAAGALAASVTYAEAAATPIFPVDDATEQQRVAAYAVSSEQDRLLQQRKAAIKSYDSSYGVVAAHASGQRAGARLYPLTVKMQSYTDSDATVSLWASLVEYSPSIFRALYLTETVALRWESGDWKLVPSRTSGTLGPVPSVTQDQTISQPPNVVDWQSWGR